MVPLGAFVVRLRQPRTKCGLTAERLPYAHPLTRYAGFGASNARMVALSSSRLSGRFYRGAGGALRPARYCRARMPGGLSDGGAAAEIRTPSC